MPNDVQAAISNAPKPEALYGQLEERILAPDRARHLEPEDPEGAGALRPRPRLVDAAGPAADAGSGLGRPGTRTSRRPVAGAPRPLDDFGPSRQRARSLPRLPRADGKPGGAQAGIGAADARWSDGCAGPGAL